MNKQHCNGCYNEFYNNRKQGDCWSLESAKLIMRKEVHIDQIPPWTQKAEKFPNCYRKSRSWTNYKYNFRL